MSAKPKLNPNQKKAVEFEKGQLLVVAGAGTGKTRVITERIKHLIKKKKINPQEILAVTFTEKASLEMLNRLDDAMPLGYEEPWIYTFHSFADRILRSEGLEIGLDPTYKIIAGPEQWLLFRRNLFEFNLNYFRPLGNPTKFISAILKFISRTQDENISSDELYKFAQEFKGSKEEKGRWLELAGVYKKYEEIKISESKMDFGDLMIWTIKLFEERPNILKKYQTQFKHMLIDEFQDTNHAQYELIKLLFPKTTKGRSILMVGDDSQSIYKFRGAAVSNILEFRKDYPKAKMVTLLENYRSTQLILDPAYKLVKNNDPDTLESKLGISKKLVSFASKNSSKKSEINPEIFQVPTIEDEVELVITKILEILARESDLTYKDFAILARANNHLDPFILALRKYGLPYQLVGNRGLYDRDEVRDILAFLRILVDPVDSISLYRVLNIKTLDISQDAISHMLSESRTKKESLWEIVKNYIDENVRNLYEVIEEFQKNIIKETPSEHVYKLVYSIDYLSQFLEEETVENQLSIRNLDLLMNKAKQFEVDYRQENNEIPTIVDFVDYVDLMIESGDDPAQAEIEDIDTINLLTVHASKGLEFPAIFMINLVGGRFPTRNRKEPIQIPEELIKETLPVGDVHIQEERRLFYVGMTRAKKYLLMTFAKNYGGKRDTVPSGFLKETGIKVKEVTIDEKDTASSQVGLFGIESGFRDPAAIEVTNFVPKFLSYSQIDIYKTCPLKYKYAYILRIPTPPSHALSFGITIHDTLRDFHTKLMFDDVSLEDVWEMYKKNWQPFGYIDEEHRNIRFESGKKLLEEYYNKHAKDKTKPVALEKSFNLFIDGIKFYGRIDRIDPLPGGGVEIIDYKTGTPKDKKTVDKDDQVAFYALGAKEALNLEPKKLSFYFVESGEKLSTSRTKKQLEEKKEEIKDTVEHIKSGKFGATPGMHCNWCNFKGICPFAWRG